MRKIIVCLAASICLLLPAQAQTNGTVSGCLTGGPGNLTLGAVPSGNTYRLQGNLGALTGHMNQLVRVTGSQTTAAANGQPGIFNVQRLEVLASTCTAPLPPQNPGAIRSGVGKAGSEQTSVPTTDTRSAGEVTPGVDTEAGVAQQPGKHTDFPQGEKNQPAKQGPLAPPRWGQVGESQQSGDRGAAAAERAEQESTHTLGVNAVPSYDKSKPQGQTAPQGGAIVSNTNANTGGGGLATETPAQANSGASKAAHHGKRKHHKKSTTQQGSSQQGNSQQGSSTPPQ